MTHLVWDWNGTLLDDLALTIEATNASLAAVGGPAVTIDEHRRTFRRPLIDYYAAILGRPVTRAEFALLDQEFHQVYRAGLATCELTADALRALEGWAGTQSLLSMWSHAELVAELGRRGLTARLVRVDGRPGPALGDLKAAYLDRHLAAIGVSGTECVLIGDSVDDADAAAAAGARCVLYTGGITAPETLRSTGWPVVSTLVEAVTLAAAGAAPTGPAQPAQPVAPAGPTTPAGGQPRR